jgi:hypothetical protein
LGTSVVCCVRRLLTIFASVILSHSSVHLVLIE